MASGKPGTVNWTAAEKTELLQTGKVSGYQGHHINSVNGHPELARDPNNIKFVKGGGGNLAEHGGNFRNPTTGELMNRITIGIQIIGLAVQIWSDSRFNSKESQTGLHSDPINGVRMSNVEKAAQVLAPGTYTKTSKGEIFTLGKDKVWRNAVGDTLYHDPKDNTTKIHRNCC